MKQSVVLRHGDCIDVMANIPDNYVDMILCDLPYGTTACKWDTIIPFDKLWEQYERIITPTGSIVLTSSMPFTAQLVSSNFRLFKYSWVWEKSRATGHVHAKNKPMKKHEDVVVFSKGTTIHASQSKTRMTYNPQGLHLLDKPKNRPGDWQTGKVNGNGGRRASHKDSVQTVGGYPTSIIRFDSVNHPIHPTQKPVALMEYLIKTYTNEDEIVLDNCMGSGTTGVACINTNRKFIGIEKDAKYFDIAKKRIEEHDNAGRSD